MVSPSPRRIPREPWIVLMMLTIADSATIAKAIRRGKLKPSSNCTIKSVMTCAETAIQRTMTRVRRLNRPWPAGRPALRSSASCTEAAVMSVFRVGNADTE